MTTKGGGVDQDQIKMENTLLYYKGYLNETHFRLYLQKMNQSQNRTMLNQMHIGALGKVIQIDGDKKLARKMMSLGIKVGSEIEILHHRGKGVVVRSKGTRIAIGESIAAHLLVEPTAITEH